MIKKSFCEASHSHSHSPTPTHSHSHSHLILDPGSAYYFAPSSVIGVGRSRIQDQVAVAGAVAVAVAVAGLTKRFLNHIQKDFLINVWGYLKRELLFYRNYYSEAPLILCWINQCVCHSI